MAYRSSMIVAVAVAAVLLVSVAFNGAEAVEICLKAVLTGYGNIVALSDPVFPEGHDFFGRMVMAEQRGVVSWIIPASGVVTELLNINDTIAVGGERGLLGLATHPAFAVNGRMFLFYSADLPKRNIIVEHVVDVNGDGSVGAANLLLEVPVPYNNHNGGYLGFGPDCMLYASFGDGGEIGSPDPFGNGQNTTNLLGTVIRIDVGDTAGAAYTVPSDNPFVGQAGFREEILAYGFRNPWRCSFDRTTTEFDLYCGDVGEGAGDEHLMMVEAGANYGWLTCASPPCKDAALTYGGGLDVAVIGGYVHAGPWEELNGKFVFADYRGGLKVASKDGDSIEFEEVTFSDAAGCSSAPSSIVAFAEDYKGNTYMMGGSPDAIGAGAQKLFAVQSATLSLTIDPALHMFECVDIPSSAATPAPGASLVMAGLAIAAAAAALFR